MRTPRIPFTRSAPATAALLAAVLIAGCGSSSRPTGAIAPGNENASAAAELKQLEQSESSSTSTTSSASSAASSPATAQTPKSGPLSKEPTVKPPAGQAPSKLVVKDLIKGKGPVAKAGDTVTVNYVGVLFKTGKVFDASWSRKETFSFTLGHGEVIAGWDKGIVGMHVGGRRELIIPAAEAYGAKGSPPAIPPNSPLIFVVDLLAV